MAIHESFKAPPIVTDLICDFLLHFETWSGVHSHMHSGVTHLFDFRPSLLNNLIAAGDYAFQCLSSLENLQGVFCAPFHENRFTVKSEGELLLQVKFDAQTAELTFDDSYVPDLSYLPFLRDLTFVHKCNFGHTRLDDLYALKTITMRHVQYDFWHMLRFPAGLTWLSFDECNFDADLSYLPNLKDLRIRGSSGRPMKQDWSKMKLPESIVTLFLCYTDYTADLSHLTACLELQMNFTETNFLEFAFPPNLRKLQIVQSPFREEARISHLDFLQNLRLEGDCMLVRDWRNVVFPPNLESLHLDGTNFSANISYLEHLQSISLHGVYFEDFNEWKKWNLPTYLQKHPESITIAGNAEEELQDKEI